MTEQPPPAAPAGESPGGLRLRPAPGRHPRRHPAQPPHDSASERAVVAALLLDEYAWAELRTILAPEDFFDDALRWCYEAAQALADRGEDITLPSLGYELDRAGRLDDAGGEVFLADLLGQHFSAAGAATHARIVARDALYRNLIGAAGEIAQTAYEGGPDADAAFEAANTLLLEAGARRPQRRAGSIDERIEQFLASQGPDGINGFIVRSGFAGLDALLQGGFHPGSLVVIAARTSAGKSSLLLRCARNAAVGQPEIGRVLLFSLEMDGPSLGSRLLGAEAEVGFSRLPEGRHSPHEAQRIEIGREILRHADLTIHDDAAESVASIRAHCLQAQSRERVGLVLIDYLQLLHSNHGQDRRESRALEVAAQTRALKELARELEAPVLVASQLNRAVDQRPGRSPLLSDLRESGAIEQDADVVLFIHRATQGSHAGEEPFDPQAATTASLIVAKQRNGPTGSARARFDPQFALFRDPMLPAAAPFDDTDEPPLFE